MSTPSDIAAQGALQPNLSPGPPGTFGAVGDLMPAFWGWVAGTGIGAGVGAGLLMALLRGVQHLLWRYRHGPFLDAVSRDSDVRRVLVLLGAGALASVALAAIRRWAGKSGGDVSESVWRQSGRMPLPRTVLRAMLSITLVGLGASLGREEAPKQIGAAVGRALSAWGRLSPPQRRLLVACGAGAGMGAVYNVPVGGALFAAEVLLGSLALPCVLPALAAAAIATAVSWLLLPNQPTYHVPPHPFTLSALVWAAVAGPILGLGSALYVRLIGGAHAHIPKSPVGRALVPIVSLGLLGVLAIAYPQLLGNGKDLTQLLLLGKGSLTLLAVLLLLKPLATAGNLASGAPGGLFTPTLTIGSLLGGLLGHLWTRLWPGTVPGTYALVGSGAFLAAATQGPVSSVALVVELTHRGLSLMVPLLLAVALATLTARRLDPRSIYSARVKIGQE